MNDKTMLNPTEAVYGFAIWLTTGEKKTAMSSTDGYGAISELLEEFCKANHLPELPANWPDNLIHPKPPWCDTVSEENPVLCWVRKKGHSWAKEATLITAFDKNYGYVSATSCFEEATRVPREMVEKLLAGYDKTGE